MRGAAVVIRGDARNLPLPDASVDLICTSPPYWAMRSYTDAGKHYDGQLGSEPTPREFIDALLACTREWVRVLKPSGSMFINLGDKYGRGTRTTVHGTNSKTGYVDDGEPGTCIPTGQDKSLLGLPWRYALACMDELGLTLRRDIIWSKSNGIPECLDPATPVFIRRDGWVSRVPIDVLTELDTLPEVLGPDGWVTIRRVWETVKPAINMHASKVEHVICSPDHRFPVSSDRRVQRIRQVPAGEIRHEGYADYLLYCPVGRFLAPTLTQYAGWDLDAITGYLVGVYAAEGGEQGAVGTGVKLTIGTHEGSFAEQIRAKLKACGITAREWTEHNARSFQTHSDRFARLLSTFVTGTVKRKKLNIELILNSPASFRQAVLDGYVDGDGSSRPGGGWSAASASVQLRDDISTLASSVGIITSKSSKSTTDKRTGNTYTAHSLWTPYITRRKTKSGMDGIYQVPPRSRRPADGENPRRMIDVEVEGGLFLIGDGLVTHNSVKDRVRTSHEYVFHLVKQQKYFTAVDEIREDHAPESFTRFGPGQLRAGLSRRSDYGGQRGHTFSLENSLHPLGKLPGSVWEFPLQPLIGPACRLVWDGRTIRWFPTWAEGEKHMRMLAREWWAWPPGSGRPSLRPETAHYAAFPMELPRRIIKGFSPDGICMACGEGRRPVGAITSTDAGGSLDRVIPLSRDLVHGRDGRGGQRLVRTRGITGYACACPDTSAPTRPSVILDPFGGTGCTAMVAAANGRIGVTVDYSHTYSRFARWRTGDASERAKAMQVRKPPPPPDTRQQALFDMEEL